MASWGRRLRWGFGFVATLMGCATTSRYDSRIDARSVPPLKSFLRQWSAASVTDLKQLQTGPREQNLAWWKNYRLAQLTAKSDPAESCRDYKSLAQDNAFPLKDLALLRSHQVCPATERLPLPETINPWYKELWLDIRLAENRDAATLLERARLESNGRLKEEMLLKTLDQARAEKNADLVAETQKALYRISPRFIPKPEPKEWLSVANDQRAHREFDKALATYQKIIRSRAFSDDVKFHALKGRRFTYKVMQRRNDYIAATTDMLNWTEKGFKKHKRDFRTIQRYHDAQVLLARTLWTEDQTSQAVKILGETQRQLKGLYPMDEVYFLRGRIAEEKGDFSKAIEYYKASEAEKVSMIGLRDKLLWLNAWNEYKLKQYADAAADFQKMKDQVKDPADKARASFWLARSLKVQNRTEEAATEWRALTQADPLGYYGLLAYRDLGTTMPPLSFDQTENLDLTLLGVGEIDPQVRLSVEWLIAANEKSFVEKILNEIVADLNRQNVSRDETWMVVSSAYARAGLYLPLFTTLGNLKPEVKDRLLQTHPDLLFPLAYRDLIDKAAKLSGTPAAFMDSIIRQESAFDPEARSPVDARGLMQLLPSVAKKIAADHDLAYAEPDDLYKPEVNIPLGAFELKNLMDRYDNQFILASAAYNANAGAIRGWINSRYRPDPVEFIEEIPYEETRAYIKLVMRNYAFYERLLNKNSATLFPEKLLAFTARPAASQNKTLPQ